MVTVSFNSAEAIRIMDAFLAQTNKLHFSAKMKYDDMGILIKIYKNTKGNTKSMAKDFLESYFLETEMSYKSYMPSFLKPKVKK